jgi:hypothetical protein
MPLAIVPFASLAGNPARSAAPLSTAKPHCSSIFPLRIASPTRQAAQKSKLFRWPSGVWITRRASRSRICTSEAITAGVMRADDLIVGKSASNNHRGHGAGGASQTTGQPAAGHQIA